MYYPLFKRVIDLLIAIPVCIVFLPILGILTLVLFIANGGSPFFTQIRPGKNERLFKIYKFRTMNNARDKEGNLLPDGDRLTAVGSFIRKTSLDELPQLFNVIKGDMSIIGPRPLIKEYLPLYNETQRQRHNVLPGITGWAQVNGRNSIGWNKKFEYDIWYIENLSFWLDLKILALTVRTVLISEGINQPGCATIEHFTGLPDDVELIPVAPMAVAYPPDEITIEEEVVPQIAAVAVTETSVPVEAEPEAIEIDDPDESYSLLTIS